MIQHLTQLREEAVENLTKKEMIFNPCREDFKLKILGKEVVIPSREIKELTYNEAVLVKKHLADQVVGEREINYATPEILADIYKEIEVKL